MRTRRGQGNIRRQVRVRKDGSKHVFWESRPYVSDSTGMRKRVCIYGASCTEVQEKLVKLRSRPVVRFGAEKTLLSDHLDHWLATVKSNRQHRTYELYEAATRNHIKPYIGAIRLGELRRDHVRDLLERRLAAIGTRMKQIVYRVLSSALNVAVEDDFIQKTPCLRKDKPRHAPGERMFLTREQALRLLDVAKCEDYYALFLLALTSGMRQGELFGLQWSAVSLDDGYLMVRAQLTKDQNGDPTLTTPKASRTRKIDLPDITIRALQAHWILQQPKGLWVFADINGEPLSKDHFVRNHFHPLLKMAGLPHIRFHDLRHTAATLLLAAGENVKVVAERLGHSSAKMTLDVYAHAVPTLQKPATAKIDEIFSDGRLKRRLRTKQTSKTQ